MATEGLVAHLESTLGRIECGWTRAEPGLHLPVRVARFSDIPVTGLTTFATLGLSNHELTQSSGRPIRAELVLSCWNRYRDIEVPAILDLVAEDLTDSGTLPSRGSIVGPAGPLFNGFSLTALYCSTPFLFPDDFATWTGSSPPTVMMQLIPVTDDESSLVRTKGWDSFEDHLEKHDPDLFDLRRGSSLNA